MGQNDPLDPYRRKRDFGRTPEPAGGVDATDGSAPLVEGARFVVHRHEASRLHYDLRLELDGVLRSWAVPKGFGDYDPATKHLAVRTEDHPLEYLTFTGTIPLGEYGGGTMQVWDTGTWHPAAGMTVAEIAAASRADAKGEIKFVLVGGRLRGEWHLVQTARGRGRDWLLFKAKDRYAADRSAGRPGLDVDLRAAPLAHAPRAFRPVVPAAPVEAVASLLDDPERTFEIDFAGVRAWLCKRGGTVRWRGDDVDARIAPPGLEILSDAATSVRAESAVLDGVVVEQDRVGTCYYAFDVLHFDGRDVRKLPLRERKVLLRRVLPHRSERLLLVDGPVGRGRETLAAVAAADLRGLVAKPITAAYGKGAGWVAIPADRSREAPVPAADRAADTAVGARAPGVRLTNLDKVLWPVAGYTKRDLIAYYDEIADVLLPYLRDRPVHLQRFPDGVEGESFYQRQPPADPPDGMRIVELSLTDAREPQRLLVCERRAALVHLANLACIDLHPWLSRVDTPDAPDWLVIDLDPKNAPFAHVVRIARSVGRLLRGIGLRPSLKTSGKTGLHVYVPLVPGYDYEQARLFAEAVARAVVRELPDIATVERDPRARVGRVYVDFLQNRRGQTVVPPYSLRPTQTATASAPLDWDELDGDLSPAAFDIRSLPRRVRERGDLFRATLDDPQDLLAAADALQRLVSGG
jgi:bifunctional non-homologous end joining protein LigD